MSFWKRLFGGVGEPVDWSSWVDDPDADKILAPAAKFRVCAYHIDHDEHPTCYVDVDSLEQAERICSNLSDLRGDYSVDYAFAYNDEGKRVTDPPW